MSDIQKARKVLAKWREDATPGPWTKRGIGYVFSDYESPRTKENGYTGTPIVDTFMWPEGGESNLALIVSTAGNPDLLDAIDKMLESADKTRPTTEWGDHGLRVAGQRIAAALIAADERMRS